MKTLVFRDEVPTDITLPVDLDALIGSRLLIQANSGAGKSRALRSMLEGTHGRVQHFVFDPEGEFGTLRERYDYLLAGKDADVPATPENAALLCRHLMQANASTIFDLSDLSLTERRQFMREFLTELLALPRELWRPLLLAIDEAHQFAPEGGDVESSEAVTNLCVLGRKRGFCPVVAVQRLSRLNKNVAAELANKMIGRTNLDVDMARAGAELGFDAKMRGTLKTLNPGEFYVYGPAICNEVTLITTDDVQTTHHQPGQVGVLPPPPPEALQALIAQLQELPSGAPSDDATASGDKRVRVREVRVEVPIFRDGEVQQLRDVADNLMGMAKDLTAQAMEILVAIGRAYPEPMPAGLPVEAEPEITLEPEPVVENLSPTVQKTTAKPKPPNSARAATLSPRQQKMLDVLAEYEAIGLGRLHRTNLAVESGQSHKSSSYTANLSTLRAKRFIVMVEDSRVKLTDAGREVASPASAPPSLEALHSRWMARLDPAEQKFLRVLIGVYPNTITKNGLAERAGYSTTSSTVGATITSLIGLGLAARPRQGYIQASATLFPRGLK